MNICMPDSLVSAHSAPFPFLVIGCEAGKASSDEPHLWDATPLPQRVDEQWTRFSEVGGNPAVNMCIPWQARGVWECARQLLREGVLCCIGAGCRRGEETLLCVPLLDGGDLFSE